MKFKGVFSSMLKPFKIFSSNKEGSEADLQKFAAKEQKQFSYETLCKATDKFDPSRKLGEGGFGAVFKGKLADGREVAVKKLSHYSRQGQTEFINEAKLLARVQHRNVVNLFGYCAHAEDKLLVYEYVSHQSLDKLLFKPDKRHLLDWKRRYEIISGIAKGLLYLHEDSHSCIIHRDIKASNVLLDDKWIPKIADFGMARLFPEDQTHVNTRVAGTNGYMAPEYVMHGHLSVKADVFSFGVLMLELISGQRNSSYNLSLDAENLLDWAYKLFKNGKCMEVLDPTIASTAIAEQVAMCVQIGLLCTQSDPSLRPTMRRVIVLLSKKLTSLEEPSRPGFPGSRYRRSRHPGATSNTGTSSASSSMKTDCSSSIMSGTATTTTPRSVGSDTRGKQPMRMSVASIVPFMIDEVISQAQATRSVLGSQRSFFGDVGGKVKRLSEKFPIIRGLLGSIKRKRSRDALILAAVIAACTLFLIIYWLSK